MSKLKRFHDSSWSKNPTCSWKVGDWGWKPFKKSDAEQSSYPNFSFLWSNQSQMWYLYVAKLLFLPEKTWKTWHCNNMHIFTSSTTIKEIYHAVHQHTLQQGNEKITWHNVSWLQLSFKPTWRKRDNCKAMLSLNLLFLV